MPSPQSRGELVALIHKSGLIAPDVLAPYESQLPADASGAARKLIQLGVITPYHADHLLAGRTRGFFLGPYRLLGKLGKGGMGAVYLAEHTGLKRRVAIKVFPPERSVDPTALARFQREGRAAASLAHPNIVGIHDVGQAGNLHFLVMEFADGQTLDRLIKDKGPLPPADVVSYARQVAAALGHAHAKGVVHRDIKPGNLIIDAEGVVKVLDMGLARITHDSSDDLTRKLDDKAVLGTADYIAPEQALHSSVDGRADLYSLGATLYALLTGAPPYGGQGISQKLLAHQLKEPRPLLEVRPDVPRPLVAIVCKLMAKRPDQRYQTAEELIAALDRLDSAQPQRAPAGRRRWPLMAAAILLTVGVAVGGGWWAMADRAAQSQPPGDKPLTPVLPAVPTPPDRPPVVPVPPVVEEPAPVYRLDLKELPPFRAESTKGQPIDLTGELAKNWRGSVWNPDTTAAFALEAADGQPALTLRYKVGKTGGFFLLRDLPLTAGRRYEVKMVYRHDKTATSMIRVLQPKKKAEDLVRLPASPDHWTTHIVPVEAEVDGRVGIEFHLSSMVPEAGLLLREVVVKDVGPTTEPYTVKTYSWPEAFRVRVKQRELLDAEGEVPAWLTLQSWADGSVVEVERPAAGRPSVKVSTLEGTASAMVFLATPAPRPERTYTLRVEYRTIDVPGVTVRFRCKGMTAQTVGRLPETTGWRVANVPISLPVTDVGTIEFHNSGARPGGTVWIGKVEWIEDGVAPR